MGNEVIFDRIAGSYDTAERIHLAKVSSEAIRASLHGTEDKTAMDFGCGTGLVGLSLLKEFRHVSFVDTASNMLMVVEQKIAALNAENAEILKIDFENPEPYIFHADYIFMAQVLLHIPDYAVVLERLYHVLNSGGHLLVVDFNTNPDVVSDLVHCGFDQEALTSVLRAIGYRNIRSRTFYSGKQIFMGKDATLFILEAEK